MRNLGSIGIVCSLLFAVGCADNQRNAQYIDYPAHTYASSGAGMSSDGDLSTTHTESDTGLSSSSSTSSTSTWGQGGAASDSLNNSLEVLIRRELVQEPALATMIPAVTISANSGTVTLRGMVSSEEQKQQLESRIRQISGVTSVDNQLQVSSSQSASSGSTEPTQGAAATESMSATARTEGATTVYSGSGGTNQIDSSSEQLGATPRDSQSSQSGMGASSQQSSTMSGSGQSGQNGGINITVQGSSQGDQTLAQQISQELKTDTSLATALSQIRISLSDGKVTLSGSVKNEQQKQDIETAIQRVTGVSSVDNQLQVNTGSTQPQTP